MSGTGIEVGHQVQVPARYRLRLFHRLGAREEVPGRERANLGRSGDFDPGFISRHMVEVLPSSPRLYQVMRNHKPHSMVHLREVGLGGKRIMTSRRYE